MTLYRDPSVKWGGMEVGGIRISHMSHLDSRLSMALTATKGVKKVFTVQPIRTQPPEERPREAAPDHIPDVREKVAATNPDAWPMLTPKAELIRAPSAGQWSAWCRKAIDVLPDVPDLDGWLMDMEQHFTALAERDADTVAAVKRAAGDRRMAIKEARDADSR